MGIEISENRRMLEAHTPEMERLESEKEQVKADLEAKEKEIAELKGELAFYQRPFYKRWFRKKTRTEGER